MINSVSLLDLHSMSHETMPNGIIFNCLKQTRTMQRILLNSIVRRRFFSSSTNVVHFKWPLGARARDRVSKAEGIIVVRSQCLNGCNRYLLERQVDKDGKLQDSIGVDEQRVEVVEGEDFVEMGKKDRPVDERGGPSEVVARAADTF